MPADKSTTSGLTVGDVDLAQLTPLPGNPRRGSVEAVVGSLKQFGQVKPIVWHREGKQKVVIAGNHTLLAARELGWRTIAAVEFTGSLRAARAFSLADNRTSDLGEYDLDALLDMLQEVQKDSALLAATAYDDDYVAKLLHDLVPPVVTDPDNVPEPPANPRSKLLDLYELGEHRVFCGSSRDADHVAAVLDGDVIDLVWTDPPYGVAYVGKTKDELTLQNDEIDGEALYDLLSHAFPLFRQHCRKGATWFVSAPAGPAFLEFGKVLTELGIWRQTLVWEKQTLVMGRSDYHYRHEALFYGWVPGAAHTPPPDRTQDSVWVFDRPQRSTEHPTMKPVALVQHSIENHTSVGDIVFDGFGGSGTTLIAAQATMRRARTIELDPVYVDVICRRFQEATGIKPVLARTGEPIDFLEG